MVSNQMKISEKAWIDMYPLLLKIALRILNAPDEKRTYDKEL
jgi:hypothetical protein